MSKAKTNKARIAYMEVQLQNLAKADIPAQAAALGLSLDASGKKVSLKFLGRDYLVGNDGVTAPDGKFVTVDSQSVLAHYLCSRGRGEISPDYVPISRLTGVASGASAGASPSDSLAKPLGDKFGADYEAFRAAALAVGAVHEGLSPAGAQSFLFRDLPKLPARIEFFEADEEFDAEIKTLFNKNANIFVSYECLELLTMCLVVELLLRAGLISDPEDCEASFL
ncbi:MAG: DUF3786 domain-containing protein [Deltaproteobacteria bacterium]|jgi:hypothetical protein|nr:DUF3786 domain-containing protein [Deltaproteobacteria bacterium]